MGRVAGVRRSLIASASIVALTIGSTGVQAQVPPAPPPAFVAPKDAWSFFAEGGLFWQADGGYQFATPPGGLRNLKGPGWALGVTYQPALSPWSFGVSAHGGKTKKKQKRSAVAQDIQNQFVTITGTTLVPGPTCTAPTISGATCTTTVHSTFLYDTITTTEHLLSRRKSGRTSSHLVLDFTIGRDIGLGRTPSGDPTLKLEAGLRYARLTDNGEYASSNFVSSILTSANAFAGKRRFLGAGPRFGASFAAPFIGDVGLEATAGLSVLFGQARETRAFTVNGVTSVGETKESRFVPGVDGSLALSYWLGANARLSVGYRAEAYFNALPGDAFSGAPTAFGQDTTFLVHGPFARATVKY